MIRADQIPDEVVEAAAIAEYEAWRKREDLYDETLPWEDAEEDMREDGRASARAVIVAVINAWPGAENCWFDENQQPTAVNLPLPQKEGDA